jgi:hypothetical protein
MNLKPSHALFSKANIGHLIAVFIERFLCSVLYPESIELVPLYRNKYKIVWEVHSFCAALQK